MPPSPEEEISLTDALAKARSALLKEVRKRKRMDRLFEQLMEAAPDAMVVVNQLGMIALVNVMAEEIFGYSREELIGQPIELLVPDSRRGAHTQHRTHYTANPQVRSMGTGTELCGLRKDGTVFPAEISLGPLQTKDGMVVFSAIRDISERMQAERDLRESRERFDLAVRGTDAGIWDWDLRTNEVYFAPRWKSMLGYSDDEISNDFAEWEARVHPDDLQDALSTVQDYIAGKTSEYELEHRLRHKDGSYRWIIARGAVVRDADGKPYRMVGSHIDVTRRKKAEEAVRENLVQLRAAQRIQEQILPERVPDIPGFELAGAYHPADFAAGDHFDYFIMPDGALSVIVGDVSGHGFSAALLMAWNHAYFRSLAGLGLEIDEILLRANSALIEQTEPGHFITAVLVRIEPESRELSYVSAGHPAGYVMDGSGTLKARLDSTSLPLGVVTEAEFQKGDPVALMPGDIVILLTDGILDAGRSDEEPFGEERVLSLVREKCGESPDQIAEALCQAAHQFCSGERPKDDITAVVIKVKTEA